MAGYTVIDVNTALSARKDGARSDLVLGGLRLEQGDRGVFITTSLSQRRSFQLARRQKPSGSSPLTFVAAERRDAAADRPDIVWHVAILYGTIWTWMPHWCWASRAGW